MVAFELGPEGWIRAPPERGFGVGVAEPVASKRYGSREDRLVWRKNKWS